MPAAVRASIEESLRNAKYLRLYAGRKLNQQSFRLKISGLRWSKLPAALPGIALSILRSVLSVNCKLDKVTSYCVI